MRPGSVAEDRGQIRDACLFSVRFQPRDHSRLNIDSNCFTIRQNALCCWDEQPSRARANFENLLTGLQIQAVDGRPRSVQALDQANFEEPGEERWKWD